MQTKEIARLREMDEAAKRDRHPAVPPHALPKSRHKDSGSANRITDAVMDYIGYMGGHASRINTQGQWDEKLGKWRKSGSTGGVSDVLACFRGRSVAVEVKAGKDALREGQIVWRDRHLAAGGLYFVARDFTSFFDWFNQTFDINPAK